MIELTVNGTPFTDFVSASVTLALDTLANDFTFTASAVELFPPFGVGDKVEVTVNRVKRLTGFIDEVNGSDREGSHTVTYTGRDKTGDFIDSQINQINDIRADDSLTLKKIIEIVIADLGQDLTVTDNLEPAPFNKAEDILSPEVGQEALDFVTQYARKRQALLTSDADGNFVITQSSPTESGAALQRLQGSDSNNIISQSWTVNGSQRFVTYIHRGQLDPRALNFAGDTDIATIEDQGAEVADTEIRSGRQRVIVESESYSSAQLQDRAKWSKQVAKARATTFRCVAKGHSKPDGGEWEENTLVQINSDVADINRKMLINALTFSQSEGQQTVTSFEFVERNAFTIDEKLLAQRPVGDQNSAFKSLG